MPWKIIKRSRIFGNPSDFSRDALNELPKCQPGVRCGQEMKKQDYQAILHSIEQAIAVCDHSSGFMDQIHLDVCRELRATKVRLLRLMGAEEVRD